MGKKRKRKKSVSKGKETAPHAGASRPTEDELLTKAKFGAERLNVHVGRILAEHEFQSAEEANIFLQQLLASGEMPQLPPRTPLEEAQDIVYDAWESTDGSERVRLARKALDICADCADAYSVLAEEAATRSLEQTAKLYKKGVRAGERALGEEIFKEDVGHFWGITETRPYMRARQGLAECLWLLGRHDEAIAHCEDMLRLNPGDNQGIRYLLIDWLLLKNRDDAAEKLLAAYEDDWSAEWHYNRALLLFRREGATDAANTSLKEAVKENRFVPLYLLRKKRLPRRLPLTMGIGDESEAMHYAVNGTMLWKITPGALEWLRKNW